MGLLQRIAAALARARVPATATEAPLAFAGWGGRGESYRQAPMINVARAPHEQLSGAGQPQDGSPMIGFTGGLPPVNPPVAYMFEVQPGAPRSMPDGGPSIEDLIGDNYSEFADHRDLIGPWGGPGYFNSTDDDAAADDANVT